MAKRIIRVRITRDSQDNNRDNQDDEKWRLPRILHANRPNYKDPPPPPSIKQLQFLEQVNLHIIPLYSTILSYTPQISPHNPPDYPSPSSKTLYELYWP
jgi:hypothetical protein